MLRDYVEALAIETATPPDLAGLCVLGAVSIPLARRVEWRSPWREPVNIWALGVLLPGERKSPVFARMFGPIEAIERDKVEAAEEPIRRAEAARNAAIAVAKKRLREAIESEDVEAIENAYVKLDEAESMPVPAKPRLVASDVTSEALPGVLAEQGGRIALLADEGGLFETLAGRYANGTPNLDAILRGHDGSNPIRVDRVSRSAEHVERPTITIAQVVQPDVLQSLGENRTFRGRGLTARFVYAVPDSAVGFRPAITASVPQGVTFSYWTAIRALDGIERLRLELTPEAAREFVAFREALEVRLRPEGDLAGIKDWANEHAGLMLRLAALFHCIRYAKDAPESVGVEELRRAFALSPYLIAHARIALDALGMRSEFSTARRILSWIKAERSTQFVARDARRALHLSAEDFAPGLALLEERGYVRVVKVATKGRPSIECHAWPGLFDEEAA